MCQLEQHCTVAPKNKFKVFRTFFLFSLSLRLINDLPFICNQNEDQCPEHEITSDHRPWSSFGDMGARVRTEEFGESTCCLGLDADPMSHQVSHDRVDSKEHLYRMAYCAMPCLVLAVTKVKMNKEGIKSKHWRWSLTMGKDGNCCVTFSTYWWSTQYNRVLHFYEIWQRHDKAGRTEHKLLRILYLENLWQSNKYIFCWWYSQMGEWLAKKNPEHAQRTIVIFMKAYYKWRP